MSADTTPISPARFASALKDLSLPMLHLKTLEIRNSIAHLQYSNDQLKPFADGPSPPDPSNPPDQDCADAIRENEAVIDRMAERIALIRAEVESRGFSWREFQSADEAAAAAAAQVPATTTTTTTTTITTPTAATATTTTTGIVTTPLAPSTGASLQSASAATDTQAETDMQSVPEAQHPQHPQHPQQASNPWTDGTFQTGTIRNGQLYMDEPQQSNHGGASTGISVRVNGQQRRGLSDEQLRAALEDRMGELGDPDEDEEGGMHL